jgi:uncharacterized protein (DUF1499 family)
MNHRPPSQLLRVLLAAAVLLPLMLVGAPLATRFGFIDYQIGLLLTAIAVLLAALVLLLTLLLMCWRRFRVEMPRLLAIAALAAVPVAVGASILIPSANLPHIHDISTDVNDPPEFMAAKAVRGESSNPLQRDAAIDAAQRTAYPQLAAIRTDAAPREAFNRAFATAKTLGWDVYFSSADRGVMEASETTFWFGFVDDIVIRVVPDGTGSRIDLRSVSRVGEGDLGANAKRIERFTKSYAISAPDSD